MSAPTKFTFGSLTVTISGEAEDVRLATNSITALSGCPDPGAFVEAMRAYANRKVSGSDRSEWGQFIIDFQRDPAFAWIREGK